MKAMCVLLAGAVVSSAVLVAGSAAQAAVVLNSFSGPVASAGQVYDYTALGTGGYVYYGEYATSAGYEKYGMNDRFSAMTSSGAMSATAASLNAAIRSSERFTDAVTGSGNPGTLASSQGTTDAARPQGTTSGRTVSGDAQTLSFAFNIGANHEIVSIYALSFDASGIMTVTQGATTLHNSGTVALPTAGGGVGSGVYSFDLTGQSASDTVTFTYTSAATGANPAIVIQGATAAVVVPEPATLGLMGLGSLALLRRRRRAA